MTTSDEQEARESEASHSPITTGKAPRWFLVGTTKLAVMSIATLNLYEIYWFYRHWKAVREHTGEEIKPFWRAFFAPLFCYSLFHRINDSARASGLSPLKSVSALSAAWILLAALAGLSEAIVESFPPLEL